jgi:hypothetical protein
MYRPALVRGAYGAVLCIAPGALIRLADASPASPRTCAVARLLGVRHLTQAALSAVRPSPALLALGVEADLLHSASMLALGALDPPRRRIGLTDAMVAAAFAAAGLATVRSSLAQSAAAPAPGEAAGPGGLTGRRDALAGRLAVLAIPRPCRLRLSGSGLRGSA